MAIKNPKLPKIPISAPGDNPGGDPEHLREIADRAGQVLLLAGRPSVIGRPGLSKSTVARIQQGLYVKRSTLVAFAEAASIRKEWLLYGTGPMTEQSLQAALAPAPDVPVFLVKTAISGEVDLDRLALAMRMAARIVEKPDDI